MRATIYLVVIGLALVSPYLGKYSGIPFAIIAASGFATQSLKWYPSDSTRREIVTIALAACGIAVMGSFLPLPDFVITASILTVIVGDMGARVTKTVMNKGSSRRDRVIRHERKHELANYSAFISVGGIAGILGGLFVPLPTSGFETVALTVLTGVFVAGITRSLLFERDTALVLLTTAVAMWGITVLGADVGLIPIVVGLVVAVSFGLASYLVNAATVSGALSGILTGFVAITVGGYIWFVLLLIFFVLGSSSTRFKYEEKLNLGIAEENKGARGFTNVMGNGLIALVAVLLYSAGSFPVVAKVLFAASIATATADTLSSEIGCVYGKPRLITTLKKVPRGTDGAVSWQGEVMVILSALLIGGSAVLLGFVGPEIGALVAVGGVIGAHVDSVLGATLEDKVLTNSSVNLAACLSGAVVSAVLYIYLLG
ncbi:MAG: DUF92 domain-containing protein [Halobacteria archaeon]|nr:DUF92 domain-containing protein [Halobacteria archaeon]